MKRIIPLNKLLNQKNTKNNRKLNFLFKPSEWKSAISEAEKLVGYSTSFLSLRCLLSDELSNVAVHVKKLVGTGHPLLKTAQKLFQEGKNSKELRGLLILLLSKAAGPTKASLETPQSIVSGIYQSQRTLAEVTEIIHTVSLFHRSVIDLDLCIPDNDEAGGDDDDGGGGRVGDSNDDFDESGDRRNLIKYNDFHGTYKDLEFGNKMAILSGDFLLASAATNLASLNNPKVVEVISTALQDLWEGEFLRITTRPPIPTHHDNHPSLNHLDNQNQSISHPINQPINQPINHTNANNLEHTNFPSSSSPPFSSSPQPPSSSQPPQPSSQSPSSSSQPQPSPQPPQSSSQPPSPSQPQLQSSSQPPPSSSPSQPPSSSPSQPPSSSPPSQPPLSIKNWEEFTFLTSGSLLARGCQSALELANHRADVQQSAFHFGRLMSLAYQLKEDITDLSTPPDHHTNPFFSPLIIYTQQVLNSLPQDQNSDEDRSDALKEIYSKSPREIYRMIESNASVMEEVGRLCGDYGKQALEALQAFQPTPAKSILVDMVNAVVKM